MKEKPILFSGMMVRAILENRKTQTRRVIVPQPTYSNVACGEVSVEERNRLEREHDIKKAKYQVGDHLWVRETFVLEDTTEYHEESLAPTDRPYKRGGTDEVGHYFLIPHYRATEPDALITDGEDGKGRIRTNWRPSIFMPRWASRITLEVTEVRVQRVQEISSSDTVAEGVTGMSFQMLWDSINEKRGYGWDSNPFVWAYTFKRIK